MTELYLIAHKVRGEPAFDVAERMPELDEDGNEGWIIPTSGHRAHPYWFITLEALMHDDEHANLVRTLDNVRSFPPNPWPDHYPTAAEPRHSPTAGRGLLARLGLLRAQAPIKRRV